MDTLRDLLATIAEIDSIIRRRMAQATVKGKMNVHITNQAQVATGAEITKLLIN